MRESTRWLTRAFQTGGRSLTIGGGPFAILASRDFDSPLFSPERESAMHWRQYLRGRTRNPEFLWKMVLGILLAGVVLGFVVQWIVARSNAAYAQRLVVAESQRSTSGVLGTLDEMLSDRALPFEELLDALAILGRPRREPDLRDIASLVAVIG